MKNTILCLMVFAQSLFGMTAENGITAHRGDSANFVQNSLQAFSSANKIGADWIETDVHLTKDGRLVLIHNATTGAYCSENKTVKDCTYAELAELDMAEKFREKRKLTKEQCPKVTIVLLDDALDLILKEKKARLSIQPKCDCVDEVMALVRKKGAVKWVGFNDANARYMSRVKELEPSVPVFWDRLKKFNLEKDIAFAKKRGFEAMVLFQKTITPENIKAIKSAGMKVGAWTVNDPATMKRFLEMGIDRLYTDKPAVMKSIKAELGKSVAAIGSESLSSVAFHPTVDDALNQAHQILTKTFLAEDGLLLDYIGEIPTPKDCAECRPNAMGWWSPIENGPMFTGPYLAAMCERARRTKAEVDRELCRKMAGGLIKAASVSSVKGMIVRGFGTDGKCHYPLGSEDQTVPWFFGLHAYAKSSIPSAAERKAIVAKMSEVADVLEKNEWKCPCDGRFTGENRGDFKSEKGLLFRGDSHYLFILRAMYDVTGDEIWMKRYLKACDEKHPSRGNMTRLDICAKGYETDIGQFPVETAGMWIYVCAQGCLRELARMDSDSKRRACYIQGLQANARRAAKFFGLKSMYDNSVERPFKYANWRTGYKWEEQTTQEIANKVANSGDKKILGHRKGFERVGMTAPLSCCAVVGYAGNASDRAAIADVIRHYDYSTLNICEFFLAEVAWYALPE